MFEKIIITLLVILVAAITVWLFKSDRGPSAGAGHWDGEPDGDPVSGGEEEEEPGMPGSEMLNVTRWDVGAVMEKLEGLSQEVSDLKSCHGEPSDIERLLKGMVPYDEIPSMVQRAAVESNCRINLTEEFYYRHYPESTEAATYRARMDGGLPDGESAEVPAGAFDAERMAGQTEDRTVADRGRERDGTYVDLSNFVADPAGLEAVRAEKDAGKDILASLLRHCIRRYHALALAPKWAWLVAERLGVKLGEGVWIEGYNAQSVAESARGISLPDTSDEGAAMAFLRKEEESGAFARELDTRREEAMKRRSEGAARKGGILNSASVGRPED